MQPGSLTPRWNFTRSNIWLSLLGLASLVSYLVAVKSQQGDGDAFPYCLLAEVLILFCAAWTVTRRPSDRWTLVIIVVFAIAARCSVLFSAPTLSTDVYRYVWDGRVEGAGINPYRYIPSAPQLAPLRDTEIYPYINRADYAPTIYPPAAQILFFLVTRVSGSVLWMKAVMTGFDLLNCWAILKLIAVAGMPRERLLLYAWHPLIVWEFAGNGHVDAAMILFVLLALISRTQNRDAWTGLFLGLGTLTKLFPVVLVPAVARRWNFKLPASMLATVAAAYLPYLRVGSRVLGFLPGYAREEGFANGSRFLLLAAARHIFRGAHIPTSAFAVFAALILGSLALWSLWRKTSGPQDVFVPAFTMAAIFTLLLSPEYTWYYCWLIPFLCFVPFYPLLIFTATALWLNQVALQSPHDIGLAVNLCLYIPLAIFSLALLYQKKRGRVRQYQPAIAAESK
jgi:alpha-1,6-mannosyltransferase